MSKILIIGEKPSIARMIVSSLDKRSFTKKEEYYESDKYVVTYCLGHLLREAMPDEVDEKYAGKWTFDVLPFYYKIPLLEAEESKKHFKVVKSLLLRKDISEVVNACDSDREGELIFRNLLDYIKPENKTYSRMWIESTANDEVMYKQFKNRKPQSLYDNLHLSAKGRSYADYFWGLNATRAMSIKNNQRTPIGRVITPTLRIVVDLEKKIRNFKSETFYKITCNTDKIDELSYTNPDLEDNRFKNKQDALNLIDKIGTGEAIVTKFEEKEETESAPKLFSLSDLQIECSKKYKFTAQEVLDACQSLYETYGLTTYPRTSENMISQEMADECPKIVKCLSNIFTDFTNEIEENNWKINNSCIAKKEIASHEALTPTQKVVTQEMLDKMNITEYNVYQEIVLRFLANFYPKAVYKVFNIEVTRKNETFIKKDKSLYKLGFYKVYEGENDKIPTYDIKLNDKLWIKNYNLIEGKTEPPKRLTEGALIKIMQSPLKFVETKEDKKLLEETGGIGTEATRSGIIENLKKYKYIEVKKSTIYPTELGMKLIDIIPTELIKSVLLTVTIENKLKLVKEGKYNVKEFIKEILEMTKEFIEDVKNSKESLSKEQADGEPIVREDEICKCPNCNSSIIEGKYGYTCSNWKNCKVQIYYNSLEKLGLKKITKTQAKELFKDGVTKKEAEFVSAKTGKPYKAKITYDFNIKDEYPNNVKLKF